MRFDAINTITGGTSGRRTPGAFRVATPMSFRQVPSPAPLSFGPASRLRFSIYVFIRIFMLQSMSRLEQSSFASGSVCLAAPVTSSTRAARQPWLHFHLCGWQRQRRLDNFIAIARLKNDAQPACSLASSGNTAELAME